MLRRLILAALALAAATALVSLVGTTARAAGEQVIAPGDILNVVVLGEADLSRRVVVDAHGKITIPLANEVDVGGITITEAAARLRNQLTKYIKNPQVTIEIAEAARRVVSVSGAVKTPGVHEITGDSTLMSVISQAGGQTPEADLSKIVVTRGPMRDKVFTVDLTEFVSGAKPEANIQVLPGDTVVVPEANPISGSVYVLGEVNVRGPVVLRQGMTFREAVAAAGGVTANADTAKVTVKHQSEAVGAPVEFVKAMAGDPNANPALKSGDTIFVPAYETTGQFTIFGPVGQPGQYPIVGKMYITDAIAKAGGATDRGNLAKVRLSRPLGNGEFKHFKVNIAKVADGRAQNIEMRPGDTILVGDRKDRGDKYRAAGVLVSLLLLLKP